MYDTKNSNYFSNVREDLIHLVPKHLKECNILEVGCGNGATLCRLKQVGIASTTTGVELFPSQENYYDFMDHFFSDDIEKMFFHSSLRNFFDVIILGDVLEHLIDPWSTLKKVSTLLAPNGYLLVSLPNIRYYSALKSILWNGDFKYEEEGILDKTHMRFFCKKNIIELFENADLKIELITSSFDKETMKSKKYLLNKITFGLFHDFFVYQYFIVATKKY